MNASYSFTRSAVNDSGGKVSSALPSMILGA